MKSKKIELEGLANTRDLGGIVNKEGKKIREKRLLRSGALYWAKGSDMQTLYNEYHLRYVIDLRDYDEAERSPEPQYRDIEFFQYPVFAERKEGISREKGDKEDFSVILRELSGKPDKIIEFMSRTYEQIASTPEAKKTYHDFLKFLLRDPEGSVLWHCSLGKDRCGIATVLLLTLLDVDEDTIREDYMYTNACFNFSKERPTYYFDCTVEQYLDRYLAAAGDLDEYIEKELKITKDDKEKLKALYLE